MAEGILYATQRAITTPNILPKFCDFNDSFAWITSSGDGNAAAENAPDYPFNGKNSVRITFIVAGAPYAFSCGGTQMNTVIPTDGVYTLQYWLAKNNPTADINFTVKVLVDGILTTNTTFTQNIYSSSGFVDGNWNCYSNGTEMNLTEGQTLTYIFEAVSDDISGTMLYFAGMKLEPNNVNQSSEPSLYSPPIQVEINETENLDFGSIGANLGSTLTVSMVGAVVGDYVKMVIPTSVATSGLRFFEPYVSATDVVSVPAYNPTASPIDAGAADFKFQILR